MLVSLRSRFNVHHVKSSAIKIVFRFELWSVSHKNTFSWLLFT